MADENTGAQSTENQETGKTFTQDELNKIVEQRLSRERSKYADYEDIKAQLAELQAETDESNQNDELEAARQRIAELEGQIADRTAADARAALIQRIAEENGVDAKYLPLLTAEDEDGLKTQAQLLAGKFAEPSTKEGGNPADVKSKTSETVDYLNALSGNE